MRFARGDPEQDAEGRSLARGLAASFVVIGTALVVLASILAVLFVYLVAVIEPAQHRFTLGGQAVRLAHAAMIDQETGLRGYLLVHDVSLLEPYRLGQDHLTQQNAAITSHLGSTPALVPLILDMRLAEDQWLTEWAAPASAADGPADAASLSAFVLRGKTLFDAYRFRYERLSDAVDRRRNDLQHQATVAVEAALAAVIALAVILAALMRAQYLRLNRAIVQPVAGIVEGVKRIAAGDLDATIAAGGPSEFRRIAVGVNEMVVSLADVKAAAEERGQVIERQAAQLREILTMARETAGSLSLRYVLRSVAIAAAHVSGFERVVIWIVEGVDDSLMPRYDSAGPGGQPRGLDPGEIGVGIVGQAARYGRAATQAEGQEPVVEFHPERALRSVAIPLVVGARVNGVIELSNPTPYNLPPGSLEVLETLSIHAAAAIETARLFNEAEHLGLTDALTGLANRRAMSADLKTEWERSTRYGRPLAVVMFDVDHFKSINDDFGHQRGDEILQDLSAVVKAELRTTDSAYRFGGEEFVVLARETSEEAGEVLAERLRAVIERHFRAHGTPAAVTASFGVAVGPRPDLAEPEELVALADQALYEAKAGGRNRVCVAPAGADRGVTAPAEGTGPPAP